MKAAIKNDNCIIAGPGVTYHSEAANIHPAFCLLYFAKPGEADTNRVVIHAIFLSAQTAGELIAI